MLSVIRSDISGREEATTSTDLSSPPMLVGTVRHGDDVAALELEFSRLLWREIVQGLNKKLERKRNKISIKWYETFYYKKKVIFGWKKSRLVYKIETGSMT